MDKKIVLLSLFACLFLGSCTPIQDMTLEEVIKIGTERTVEVYNKYRKGYKYNLPKGLETYDNSEYNEIIMGNDYTYYLYVDAVSYYNKVIENNATKFSCHLLSLDNVYTRQTSSQYLCDSIHPNFKGMTSIANVLYNQMKLLA